MTHGTADDFITPHNSIAYYKRQVAQFGQSRLDSFMRFYYVPGLGHGFGVFNAKFDGLDVLRDWVEKGRRPQCDGDGRQSKCESHASTLRVSEVAEVHRSAWHGKPAASFTCVQ